MTRATQLQRNEDDFVTAELDCELVLMHLTSNDYFGMDKTTTQIWKLLAVTKSVDALVTDLANIYEVEQTQCAADILPVLENMVARAFLRVVSQS